ncbi:MAG: transcriptional repressor [Pirellulaceae bacterium]|jgi:Fur family transcriptional regulator, ferric uptake regulator|nr:transcriptional repressor [Pirellulaceae bacterium]
MHKDNKELDEIKDSLRSCGLRATPARIALLQFMRKNRMPLTHADVAKELSYLGIDAATVFRNLNSLAEAGLLRKIEIGDHVWRFEVINSSEGESGEHPHFLCVDCGSITCLDEVKLTAGSHRATASVGVVTEIMIRGHCNDCNEGA